MAKKMLIDATHAEETRVVVVDGNKVEEFDFESASKRQLAGNIYLAKVTRVEPSLQAAFVDYGGNRHGFLAFSEIHPDYYQIPVADREALLAEERAYAEAQSDEDEAEDDERRRASSNRRDRGGERGGDRGGDRGDRNGSGNGGGNGDRNGDRNGSGNGSGDRGRGGRGRGRSRPQSANGDAVTTADGGEIAGMEMIDLGDAEAEADAASQVMAAPLQSGSAADTADTADIADTTDNDNDNDNDIDTDAETPDMGEDRGNLDVVEKDDTIETVAEEDDTLDMRPRQKPRARRYKIQEVIKVRQIMLIQVVKEERGNKGAALTTYLSLAGRYCVLMPNTARGGGISRKITNAVDRKKLKEIAEELDVPQGAGLIIRTAGSQRTKAEIKRDYEYLQRLWEQIRELTLKSIAPAKIYEEGDLIKRSIRDLYSKDIDEVIVEGVDGYRTAKEFMKMIMPSHAKNVKLHAETMPLFARHQVEGYLSSMFNPVVQLPSGGYIVIGVTEALVAIDVNSGRATKEGSIEQTALKTNLEASDEVARQLRLRDLAGLIVVDYIDMDERKNNAAVEKRFKDRLKTDRARIQVGRISGFGLLEMSRQRLRPGMLEATTQPCPHCHGTGLLRSDDNVALGILRQLEEEGVRGRSKEVLVKVPAGIMNFLMNQKRENIAGIEVRYGMAVRVESDLTLISPDFSMEKFKIATRTVPEATLAIVAGNAAMMADLDEDDLVEDEVDEVEADASAEVAAVAAPLAKPAVAGDAGDGDDRPRKKRRRRRRRRGAPGEGGTANGAEAAAGDDDDGEDDDGTDDAEEGANAPDAVPAEPKRRGRNRSRTPAPQTDAGDVAADAPTGAIAETTAEPVAPAAPAKRGRGRKAASPAALAETVAVETVGDTRLDLVAELAPGLGTEPGAEPAPKPARAPRRRKAAEPVAPASGSEVVTIAATAALEPVTGAVVASQFPAPEIPGPELPEPEPYLPELPGPEPYLPELPVPELPEPEPEVPELPEPELPAPESETPADPDRPKRRGWWSQRS